MRHLTEEERLERCAGFLASVTVARPCKDEEPCPQPEIAAKSMNLLAKAAMEPGIPCLQMYEALHLHPAEGHSAVDDLLARGFVKPRRVARRGRGGQPVVLEVLESGKDVLRKSGISPAPMLIARGGFKHDCYARWLRQWAHKQGRIHWFERTLGVKAFDFVFEDKEGSLHGIEIVLTGSAGWNAEQAIKAASVVGVCDVVIACETSEMLKQIASEVSKMDELGLYRNKVFYKLLSEYSPW